MGNHGPSDDIEEKEHFQRIVNAFRYYRWEQKFYRAIKLDGRYPIFGSQGLIRCND